MVEKKFIDDPIHKYKMMKFLEENLNKAWIANIDIQRTPLATRITLETLNPGRVIGRKGRSINKLTDQLKAKFGVENPQINVAEVTKPYLEPMIVAKKASRYIEIGKKVRAVMHYLLKEIMGAGAMGAEIVAAGKIGAKGARAKTLRVYAGYIPKSGEPTHYVRRAHYNANTKSGIIGVLVRIVPPGTKFPDKEVAEEVALPKVVQAAEVKGRQPRGLPEQVRSKQEPTDSKKPVPRGKPKPTGGKKEVKKAPAKKEAEKKVETKSEVKKDEKPSEKKGEKQ